MRKLFAPLFTLLLLTFAFLISFTVTAFAAGAAEPADGTLLDYLTPVVDAFKGGQYAYGGALALVLFIALVKRYGAPRFPWLNSDVGGSVLALLSSFGATLATTIGTGGAFGVSMLWTAGSVAVTAAGGYTLLKKLVMDPLLASAWYKALPATSGLKDVIGIVGWIFGDSPVIPNAEAAGVAAVKANPAKGMEAASGAPVEMK